MFMPTGETMATIRAIYENGVFRPLAPVDLPEGSRVELCNLQIEPQSASDQVDRGEVSDLDMDVLLDEL
jgi:predicted DNA-binding antitoxin AbrB/MazE fold protein